MNIKKISVFLRFSPTSSPVLLSAEHPIAPRSCCGLDLKQKIAGGAIRWLVLVRIAVLFIMIWLREHRRLLSNQCWMESRKSVNFLPRPLSVMAGLFADSEAVESEILVSLPLTAQSEYCRRRYPARLPETNTAYDSAVLFYHFLGPDQYVGTIQGYWRGFACGARAVCVRHWSSLGRWVESRNI